MLSVPYSRYLIYPIPWYSFLIVFGASLALFLACKKEKRIGLKKDTMIDLALWILPAGIIGARIYYVFFSLEQFRDDPLSVLRIWEGGLAIYGGIIAGIITLLLFCRVRKLSPLLLCDIIAPGLALAQSIGRWGNYFNMEAYGMPVSNPSLCFFPLAVQIPEGGVFTWHMATFFYESLWDAVIFLLLINLRRKILRRTGDTFFLYLFLYAAGRFVIEELRIDSLYIPGSVRISQLLSVLICFGILVRYSVFFACVYNKRKVNLIPFLTLALTSVIFQLICSLSGSFLSNTAFPLRILLMAGSSLLLIAVFLFILVSLASGGSYADNRT